MAAAAVAAVAVESRLGGVWHVIVGAVAGMIPAALLAAGGGKQQP
jgi:putative Ca2+/H+ antiporter (TMEM165/GDT1 family)